MARGNESSVFNLRGWAKGRIEKCKVPDYVLKMEALPYLSNSKIDKNALREQAIATLESKRSAYLKS